MTISAAAEATVDGNPDHNGTGNPSGVPVADGSGHGGLVDRLTAAVTAAIANERPSLEYKPQQVRGLVVEVSLRRDGRPIEATVYVERRLSSSSLRG